MRISDWSSDVCSSDLLMSFRGLERVPVEEAKAGDIISLAGLTVATVANTIADISVSEPLHAQPIDPPTLSMRFAVNDSPMAGREGTKVTSRMIRDRLFRSEAHTSELQSLMRIAYAVLCLKKKKTTRRLQHIQQMHRKRHHST